MRLGLADIRDTVFITIACAGAGALVLASPPLGLPLCAVALSWMTYRRNLTLAVIVAVVAGVIVGLPYVALMALTTLAMLVVGPYASSAMRNRPAWVVVAVIALVTVGVTLGMLAAEAAVQGLSLPGLLQQFVTQWGEILTQAGTQSGQTADAVRQQVDSWKLLLTQTWPAYLLVTSVAGALLSVWGIGWVGRRAGQELNALPSLERLDLSWHLTWGAIAGLGLLALTKSLGITSGALPTIAWNVMLITRAALFLQGLAVFSGLYHKARIGRFGRTIGYVFLLITESITPLLIPIGLVSITGLVDLWINVRKLPRRGQQPPSVSLEEPEGRA